MNDREKLRGELARFLLVGGVAVAIDGLIYFMLVHTVKADPVWAKRVSFAIGAVWAFLANKFFTFRQRGFAAREPLFFMLVYVAGWFLNSVVHDFSLSVARVPWFAFLAATGVSTCSNFVGQKWLVFRERRQPAAP